MMTTSTPETPVLRVTYPKTETTPTTSQSPKQKDPKKVAAGRAGAASRKVKAERLERELAKAKESLRDPKYTSGAPLHSNEEDVPAPPSPQYKKQQGRESNTGVGWLYVSLDHRGGGWTGAGLLGCLATCARRSSGVATKEVGNTPSLVSGWVCSAIKVYTQPVLYGIAIMTTPRLMEKGPSTIYIMPL